MKKTLLLILLVLMPQAITASDDNIKKIEFNLAQFDADGLRGPADGKTSLTYEFAIPNTPECIARVKAIDPSIQFSPGSSGRVHAGKNEVLCIGNTHRKDHLKILRSLSDLPFVKRIIECFFE